MSDSDRGASLDPRKVIVASGYDAIAEAFLAWSLRIADPTRDRLLGEVMARLPARATVLDLGCGAGLLSTSALAERFRVTGVDLSAAQIAAARRNVPAGDLHRGRRHHGRVRRRARSTA